MVSEDAMKRVLGAFHELGLCSRRELEGVVSVFLPAFPFTKALREADSVHVHGRVDDVATMPRPQILALGAIVENESDGYIKYAFEGGVNMIYSSIDVAEDDRLADRAHLWPRPFIDHIGIDLRRETAGIRSLFDTVPEKARDLGWRHVAQGNDEKAVYCCHTSVGLKHWVYPTEEAAFGRPIEFAFGPLTIHRGKMGCDLRPLDPADPRAAKTACCGGASAKA